ncbi:type I restriction endonuclease subunit R [Collinsella sp. BA40]|uniref:type I restriction endonuclease subunit R n=1 Tax=Collinsella sp. BA40 TaxID=2560852 RepID=UPI0011CAA401|nr:type I restriction endonuclease subunit R [Collinsella sp. BA40]TXF35146.1 type I restriction endonuclease subunit R [Collinsella sp. BA40]
MLTDDLELAGGSPAPSYSLILEGPSSTVCAQVPEVARAATSYQTEAQLEKELIEQLVDQGYERVSPASEAELIANLRRQIELLNGFAFADEDWERFFREVVANKAEGIVEKTRRIQKNPVIDFTLANGTLKNVMLLDRDHIYRNRLQVMNQYEASEGAHKNRYDVTVLVNGLPLVHIELKRRGVALRQAFDQIERYQRESFWSQSGLFEFVQIFVISNGTHTKYYSNTTRWQKTESSRRGKKSSASFAFTSWWTDANNHKIADLVPFAASFLARGTLLMILTHYCVLDVTNTLLVMRPYQICACEKILNRILVSEYDKRRLGTLDAGGYIWHTTGSGKTLTSFKTAQLAAGMEGVDKVLFVVDRKDLDYQTMKEYNKFQEGAVNGSKNTHALAENLEAPLGQRKICVTTINKLAVYLKRPSARREVFDRHTVFIFDECHRSQFGEMHKAITRHFKNYHLFGFTGTPIFAQNAGAGADPELRTTAQAFGDCLHTYTVVNAIDDGNVLPFKVDYVSTFHRKAEDTDARVEAIDTDSAWLHPERLRNIAGYILDNFDRKTKRSGQAYSVKGAARRGFNAILACDSIKSAESYYRVLREMIGQREGCDLKVATIFSFAPNAPEDPCGFIDDEELECDGMPQADRDFLDGAIANYNAMFSTSFSTDSQGFDGYYKDVSRRMKGEDVDGKPLPQDECLDLLIVVDMFLTGFDAKTLNTLWVDKNLRMHGLIQAFSRTNRILNSVKTFGNVVCFRNLEENVDEAIGLFGDPKAGGIVLLKPYDVYFEEYAKKLAHLREAFSFDALDEPMGEEAERDFIKTFSAILRLRNILSSFDGFEEDDTIDVWELQDYQSVYLDLRDKLRGREQAEKESIADDLVFEMELVRQLEINIDYILMLVEKRHGDNVRDREIAERIRSSVAASPELRDKQDLIDRFLEMAGFCETPATFSIDPEASEERRHEVVSAHWRELVRESMETELGGIIECEHLKPDQTRALVSEAFETGGVPQEGTAVASILPPVSRFAKGNPQAEKRRRVTALLSAFYDRFRSLTAHYPMRDEAGAR